MDYWIIHYLINIYLSKELYDKLPCKYMAISIGKGFISWNTIQSYIDRWARRLSH